MLLWGGLLVGVLGLLVLVLLVGLFCCFGFWWSGFDLLLGSYLTLLPASGDLRISCTQRLDSCKKMLAKNKTIRSGQNLGTPPARRSMLGALEGGLWRRSRARLVPVQGLP